MDDELLGGWFTARLGCGGGDPQPTVGKTIQVHTLMGQLLLFLPTALHKQPLATPQEMSHIPEVTTPSYWGTILTITIQVQCVSSCRGLLPCRNG